MWRLQSNRGDEIYLPPENVVYRWRAATTECAQVE